MDPIMSTMVVSISRPHLGEKIHWLTYTNETEMGVEILERTGKRVTAALAAFGPTDVCKVALGTDSSTAQAIIRGLNDPASKPEHHTAMARKWQHWGERVEFTVYWNMHVAHCKGELNHYADWLSHIGHLLDQEGKRISSRPKHKDVFSVSADKAMNALKKKFPVPAGWTLKGSTFNLDRDQWKMVSDAQKTDKISSFQKISIGEMFSGLTEVGDCSALSREKVRSWDTKIFAIVPDGASDPVLFVPQSMTRCDSNIFERDDWNEDLFDHDSAQDIRNLVLLIPQGLHDLQLSQITPLEGDPPKPLREDICLLFHEWDAHISPADMFEAISKIAWWPSIKKDIYEHWKYCSLCMSKRHAKRFAGMGFLARVKHRHISGDHVIFPKWLADIVGCVGLFCVMDLASGELDIFICQSTGSEEAISHLFNGWCRYRGFFYTFSSDQGVAFTAKVCAGFMKLIGLKVHRMGAVADSRAQASIEHKNKLVREMEAEISENGTVTCLDDLKFFITRYLYKYTMLRKSAGSTVFERIRGVSPITLGDLLTEDPDISSDLISVSDQEAEFLKAVASATAGMMADHKVEQQVRARDNAYARDSKESKTKGFIQNFEVGQLLSLGGKKVTVLSLEGWDGTTHIVANVQQEGKEPRRVKCEDLRELCWGRPQWSPSQALNIELGDFIFVSKPEEDFRRVGIIMEFAVDDLELVMHEYSSNTKTRTRWLPVWEKADKIESRRICPSGWTAHLVTLKHSDIQMSGKIKGEVLTDCTKRRLLAKGYYWALPVGSPGSSEPPD
jgi:hypothetical protein